MFSTSSRIFTQTLYGRLLSRSMISTYGIETNEGIYEIKRLAPDKPSSKTILPDILRDQRIIFYNCRNNDERNHPIEEILTLRNLTNQIASSSDTGTYFKGYLRKPSYQPSVVTLDNSDLNPKNSLLDLNKTVFEWTNDGHLRIVFSNATQETDSEFYIEKMRNIHPVFEKDSIFTPVYKTFDQAIGNLKELCKLQKTDLKDELLDSLLQEVPSNDKTQAKHPFIVIEGLDGTGKSTMTGNFGKYMDAEVLGTPPRSIKHIREEFDVYPELCRRSFYAYSNYLAAKHIRDALKEKTVVLDRYWHSTTAYAIAKDACEGIGEHLPPPGDDLYRWPDDLLRPSAVVFLTTKEKERDHRMSTTRDELTHEEQEMSESRLFRKRILEVYRRIGFGDKWIEVDTGGTQEESLKKAVEGLKKAGVI